MIGFIISRISSFSTLPGIYFGIKNYRVLNKAGKLILLLMVVSLSADVISLITGRFKLNNMPIMHIYSFLQGVILILFFKEQFLHRKALMNYMLFALIFFHLCDSFWFTGLFKPNAIAMTVQSFLMIVLSLAYFYKLYSDETDIFFERNPDFLFVLALLFYFSGAFFSWLLSSEILSWASPLGKSYGHWILHNIANIIKNGLFAVALWRVQKA